MNGETPGCYVALVSLLWTLAAAGLIVLYVLIW